MNKEYNIQEQINRGSREKNKKIKIKDSTTAKLLFVGMFLEKKVLIKLWRKLIKGRSSIISL